MRFRWHAEVIEEESRAGKQKIYVRKGGFVYKFRVNGIEYFGRNVRHSIWPGPNRTSRVSEIEDFLDAHARGREVEVIYRANDPADCMLETSQGVLPYVLLALGAFVWVTTIIV